MQGHRIVTSVVAAALVTSLGSGWTMDASAFQGSSDACKAAVLKVEQANARLTQLTRELDAAKRALAACDKSGKDCDVEKKIALDADKQVKAQRVLVDDAKKAASTKCKK